VLLIANRIAARASGIPRPLFAVSVVGCGARSIAAAGGVRIGVQRWSGRSDLLVVPGFDFEPREGIGEWLRTRRREVSAIAAAFKKGVPVTALCVGAFLLGEAALLDGRRATTAWAFAGDLARRHPAARVEPTSFVVEDGGVTTTAAFTAALDLAIHLVQRHAGDAIARATGNLLLVAGPRETQAPYVDHGMLQTSGGSFSEGVQHWLLQRVRQRYELTALAKAFHVSTRTLLRRFKAETGGSPLDFLQASRVERAKELLESTTLGVAEVMDRVGYADLSTFRRLFVTAVGMSPASYRRQFRRTL
jgi:transcriptional regulator GlxA family with amidase domain